MKFDLDKFIEYLNEINKIDSTVLKKLFFNYVPCNVELLNHPTCICGESKSIFDGDKFVLDKYLRIKTIKQNNVGILGVINGFLTQEQNNIEFKDTEKILLDIDDSNNMKIMNTRDYKKD